MSSSPNDVATIRLPSHSEPGPAQRIGLIAGWGDFPLLFARRLHELGYEVYCVGVEGHYNPQIAAYCKELKSFGIGQMGAQVRFLRRHGVQTAAMAGKIFKTLLFQRWALWRHRPDWLTARHFFHHFFTGRKNRNDDSLLLAVTALFRQNGITMLPATSIAPELLVKEGLLTSRSLAPHQWRDISFGWQLAKEMGRLDIGQSVAVKGRAVLAVEAIEGTDECIRRAGQLCPAGGFVVVKVAKPNQDMRFDVPTVGLGTIQTMRSVGAKLLAIEAGRTIILNPEEMLALANSAGISVIAVDEASLQRQAAA